MLKASFRAISLLTIGAVSLWAGREFTAGTGDEVAADELIIRLKPGADSSAVLAAAGGGSQLIAQAAANLLVRAPRGIAALASSGLARHAQVDYVEPNHIRRRMGGLPALNDPSAGLEWALTTVKAAQAWGVIPDRFFTAATAGTGRIRVAILDTGGDCTHSDFKNSGGSSVDSAQGGQLNLTLGQAFVATTRPSPACAWQDDHGHGTHVMGTVAAATQNSAGVASLGYPIELVIYKVLDSAGSGTDFTISQAIRAAADAGVHFVSMSLGGTGYSQTFQDAINYAWERNTLVIAAAGNSNVSSLFFPAGANYTIGVAATDSNNIKAGFSNWGPYNVDVAAPGVNIYSTAPSYANPLGITNYGYLSGTSMATPHVSALAGLIALTTPNFSVASVAQRIQQSANSSFAGGGWDQYQGYGIIDAWRAVTGNLRSATVGGIVGQVVDSTAIPIAGAVVTAGGQNFTTLSDGLYRIQNLAAGSYNLQVTASGFATRNLTVVVRPGADTTATVPMGVVTGKLTGTVTSGGQPLAGAIVQALASGLIKGTAITDSNGLYVLAVLPGTYDIQVSGVSRLTTTAASNAVSAGGTTTVNMPVPGLGAISGTVRDNNSALLSGAQVAFSLNGAIVGGAITDGSGAYSSIGLAAGTYSVTASATGFPDSTVNNVIVTSGAASTVNFQMGGSSPTTARGTSGYAAGNAIQNTSFGPLSGSNGPFTIAFWFKSGGLNPSPSYIVDAEGSSAQWAVIYGYSTNQLEFYNGDPAVRPGTGITIGDTNWHHVAYRKSGPGAAAWDKFLDGVKTPINASVNFSFGALTRFYAFNIENLAPCNCSMSDIVIYDTSRPDLEIANLAAGTHPAASPVPLLYWPLSGTGSVEVDASGNGHPGTVAGAVNSVPGPPFTGTPLTAAPVFTPGTGTYAPGQQVTITTTTPGASIRYTMDGSAPTSSLGTPYAGAITVNATTTIRAIAYAAGFTDSSVTTAVYTISSGGGTGARGTSGYAAGNAIQNTTFGPLSGSNGPFTIAFWFKSGGLNPNPSYIIDAETPGGSQWAVIYGYSANQLEFYGNDPAIRPGTGITISDTNWHHIAYRKSASGAAAWDKFIDGVKNPINTSVNFSFGSLTRFYAFNIENLAPCNCSMSDVVIYDTARPDLEIANLAAGTHPAASPIPVLYWPLSGSGSLEADASGNNHPGTVVGAVNPVAGPNYSGVPLTAAPVVSPGTGAYAPGQQVTISTTTPGASIRYTTDGSAPTSTIGTPYAGAITVNTTATIRAIAYAAGLADSSVTSATYTISGGGTGARGTSGYASGNAIQNTGFGPLSGSNGPFTIAFWFKSGGLNPNPSYVLDAETPGGSQWAVIYGYNSNQLEFYGNDPAVRPGTAITINDTNWHHIAYRKSAAGAAAWDKFVDGVKSPINASVNFTFGALARFYAFNVENLAPCNCSMSDVVIYDTARPDLEIANLAAGTHPAASPVPVLYWPLSGSGSVEADASGNNHPGTVVGAVNPVAGPNYSGIPLTSAPVFSPGPGTYAPGQPVTITSATNGASIRYTADGSTPTSSVGTPYVGAITVNTTTTIRAIAYAAGFADSSVSSATYTMSSGGSGARGTSAYASGNTIKNTSFGPLSGSNGPFTIAFWFKSGGLNPNPSYIIDSETPSVSQWAVIYGYSSNQLDFYTGDPNVRAGTGITISDTNWHHIAYRKSAAGAAAWDKFVDGVKTPINASINFTFGALTRFYAFNIENLAPANCSLMDIVIYDTARPDSEIANLASLHHPAASPVPVLYWPLSGTGSLENDASGNGHPGTVVGSVNPVAGPF